MHLSFKLSHLANPGDERISVESRSSSFVCTERMQVALHLSLSCLTWPIQVMGVSVANRKAQACPALYVCQWQNRGAQASLHCAREEKGSKAILAIRERLLCHKNGAAMPQSGASMPQKKGCYATHKVRPAMGPNCSQIAHKSA